MHWACGRLLFEEVRILTDQARDSVACGSKLRVGAVQESISIWLKFSLLSFGTIEGMNMVLRHEESKPEISH